MYKNNSRYKEDRIITISNKPNASNANNYIVNTKEVININQVLINSNCALLKNLI